MHREENVVIRWEIFEKELLVRFGQTEIEDYDEALSRIHQRGTLREYQRDFERLANRIMGWPQKALVGTFTGVLKDEILEGVRMFKPRTLRDAIELARMREDSLARQRRPVYPSKFTH